MDALCLATYATGEIIAPSRANFYQISFRPRQVRRHFHDLPRKEVGRVPYQRYAELEGFRKGDIVRVKGEPANAKPGDCRLLERGHTVVWDPR